MKFDIYSDLHLDSWQIHIHGMPVFNTAADIALIAGDIGNGLKYTKKLEAYLDNIYDRVFIVNGNHDFYKEWNVNDQVFNSSNRVYDVNGQKLVTSTLWTDFRNSNMIVDGFAVSDQIADFSRIRHMTIGKMKQLATTCIDFLLEHQDADIVMTHWPPLLESFNSNRGDPHAPIARYFVNHKPDLVDAISPKLWVHGHTHDAVDYMYNDTRVVSNPIGYESELQTSRTFTPMTIEV